METTGYRRVGEHLREFRERAGLSQRALAPLVSVSHATISKWEGGSRPIDANDLPKLARVLGVNPRDFFPEPVTEKVTPISVRVGLDEAFQETRARFVDAAEVERLAQLRVYQDLIAEFTERINELSA